MDACAMIAGIMIGAIVGTTLSAAILRVACWFIAVEEPNWFDAIKTVVVLFFAELFIILFFGLFSGGLGAKPTDVRSAQRPPAMQQQPRLREGPERERRDQEPAVWINILKLSSFLLSFGVTGIFANVFVISVCLDRSMLQAFAIYLSTAFLLSPLALWPLW